MTTKTIGLLLGDENDWPIAFESLLRRLKPNFSYRGAQFNIASERIRIEPFALNAPTKYNTVIDRIGYWHTNPREWLKKAALLNNTYLLNNPFTFQSMEKHTAYCAMVRLGLNIPETWLIPPKAGPADRAEKFATTAARYHDLFDLPTIANQIGYPLFMKPFDGGGWRGVSRIDNEQMLMEAYDNSSGMLMHLQKGMVDYEVFVRSLGIGPQVINLNYDPSQPQHGRYVIDHDFLSAEKGREAQIITKVINAFFHWDFNSCEALLNNGVLSPIDFANACPDIAITSLHYYFPWAIKSLVAWSIFCTVTERRPAISLNMSEYFAIADSERSYWEKLEAYELLADCHLQSAEFEAFVAEQLPHLDEAMWDLVNSAEFDQIIVDTVHETFPSHEREQYIAHYRGLLSHWAASNQPK